MIYSTGKKEFIARGLLEAWEKIVFSLSNYDSIHMSEFILNSAHCKKKMQVFFNSLLSFFMTTTRE